MKEKKTENDKNILINEKAQNVPISLDDSKTYDICYDRIENGVYCLRIEHDTNLWRLGTTNTTWRNTLIHVPPKPSQEDLNSLQNQGLWLREDIKAPKVAIVCCGMGSVWPGMGRALYDTFPAARDAIDSIAAVSSWDIFKLLDATEMEQITPSRWQQPYLFLVEYAQASYLASLGFKADVVSGHSIGELVGLCLAGVATPKDAWEMLNIRATMMGEMEGEGEHETGMMVVYASEEVVQNTLKNFPNLLISNYNSPRQFVLSGLKDELMQARRMLRKEKHPALVLNVNMAFHHPQMRSRRQASLDSLWTFPLQGATTTMMSCVTTGQYPQDKAGICEYIADLDENAVRWIECVQAMWNEHEVRHFVELGPADTVTGFTSEIKPEAECFAVSRKQNEVEAMRAAVARLYALGHIPSNNAHAVPMEFSLLAKEATCENVEKKEVHEPIPSYVADILPLFAELTGHEVQTLRPHMDLRHDLGMRSSRFPFIMHALEKQFSIQLRIEDLVQVLTLHDLALVVARLRKQENVQENIVTHGKESLASKAQQDLSQNFQKIRRYVPHKYMVTLEQEVFDASMLVTQKKSCGALIIGQGSVASLWESICIQNFGKEKTAHAANVAQARKLLQQGFKPNVVVYVVQKTESQDKKIINELMQEPPKFCKMMEDAFLVHSIDVCFVHGLIRKDTAISSAPSDCLYNSFLATFAGVFRVWQAMYPAVQCHCVGSERNVKEDILEKYLKTIIMASAKKLLPMTVYVTHEGIHTYSLFPQEYDTIHGENVLFSVENAHSAPFVRHETEENVRQGPVLIVAQYAQKDFARIQEGLKDFSECLKAFAPLEATLVWIGDYTPELELLRSLEACGLKCTAIICDMQRREAVRAAIHGVVNQHGHIDGLIYDACSAISTDFDNIRRQRNALQLLVSEAYSHGVRNALAMVHFHPILAQTAVSGQEQTKVLSETFPYTVAGYFEENCQSQGFRWRCVWLPRQERELVIEHSFLLRTMAQCIVREFFCGSSGHVYYAKDVHELHMPVQEVLAERVDFGFKQNLKKYPYCYPLSFAPVEAHGVVQRDFSSYTQGEASCIKQKNFEGSQTHDLHPLKALFALCEGAELQYAWLQVVAFIQVEFLENSNSAYTMGMVQESKISYTMVPHDDDVRFVCLDAAMRLRVFAPNGRRTDKWQNFVKAKCLLTGAQQDMDVVLSSALLDMTPEDKEVSQDPKGAALAKAYEIKEFSLSCVDIAQHAISWYSFIPLCLDNILKKIFPEMAKIYVRSADAISFLPFASKDCDQELLVTCEVKSQKEGHLLNIRMAQADGTILLFVRNMWIV